MSNILSKDIKIYHIVHVDKLESIVSEKTLFSDAQVRFKNLSGTTIGMNKIKQRRLSKPLFSHANLTVGECVPFYFCPRSPMLYMFHKNNHADIHYHGGQEPIVHLVLDMNKVIRWADNEKLKWAFTDSNAGSSYFNDYCNLIDLDKLDWSAINSIYWSGQQDKKMAEFLVEKAVSWDLVEEIGVYSKEYYDKVNEILSKTDNGQTIMIKRQWYY